MEECRKSEVSVQKTKELSVYKGERRTRLLTRDVCFPVSKYFTYLSGLTA